MTSSLTPHINSSVNGGRYISIQTPYQILLQRGISGIYSPRRRRAPSGMHEQYYSCDVMGYKTPLHPYTSVDASDGKCTAFYHNPISQDVWLASETTGEPILLTLGRLPHQVLYNQLYMGQTIPGHILRQ